MADADDCSSNPSNNRCFDHVLHQRFSRRRAMKGGLSLAVASFFSPPLAAFGHCRAADELVNFAPVPNAVGETEQVLPSVSVDYDLQVLIPWGTPLQPGAVPEYTGAPTQARPTAEQAQQQIGIGHDGMWYFPYRGDKNKGLLVVNHEYGNNSHVLGKSSPDCLADVRLSQAVHGVSVVAIEKKGRQWQVTPSRRSRRITVNTPVEFSGPAADSDYLQNPINNEPMGTVNNCGSSPTPWGTYLTCEENFNFYFGATTTSAQYNTEGHSRYGLYGGGTSYGWHNFDERFDLASKNYINECNRFGWVVEIDPFHPSKKPVKRTALGRFKHEGVANVLGKNGRVVVYMGDDQSNDYVYKYVADDHYKACLAKGKSPLDKGTLYCARFNDDGSGEWLPLTIANPILKPHFTSQAQILVYTRLAADLLGATPMGRPEWTAVGQNGMVYCTLSSNSGQSQVSAVNPRTHPGYGLIVRWLDSHQHTGTSFQWEVFKLASESQNTEACFANPDALWADDQGRLFVGTDGGQQYGLQNQLMVFNTQTGQSRRLLTGVYGDEITGITVTPDQRTLFVNIQHPGGGSPSLTSFPAAADGVTIPRDATLVITRKDGGIVGS